VSYNLFLVLSNSMSLSLFSSFTSVVSWREKSIMENSKNKTDRKSHTIFFFALSSYCLLFYCSFPITFYHIMGLKSTLTDGYHNMSHCIWRHLRVKREHTLHCRRIPTRLTLEKWSLPLDSEGWLFLIVTWPLLIFIDWDNRQEEPTSQRDQPQPRPQGTRVLRLILQIIFHW
jgi:hypothetical protein